MPTQILRAQTTPRPILNGKPGHENLIEHFFIASIQCSVNRTDKHIQLPSPTHQQIAERAYQIYLANGCREGRAHDDWLQAQYELAQQPIRELVKINPTKKSRIPANIAMLAGVVHVAVWLAQQASQ
jgi:Protein of unknown function (DUF2934)